MIFLDEEFLGKDPDLLVIRALKVCGGFVCELDAGGGNTRFVGAHFTHSVNYEAMKTGLRHLNTEYRGNANVLRMYFALNATAWKGREDKFKDKKGIANKLREIFDYNGRVYFFDKNDIGNSVDVKMISGEPGLYYRSSPANDELVKQDVVNFNNNTLAEKLHFNYNGHEIRQLNNAFPVHSLSTVLDGWENISEDDMMSR